MCASALKAMLEIIAAIATRGRDGRDSHQVFPSLPIKEYYVDRLATLALQIHLGSPSV